MEGFIRYKNLETGKESIGWIDKKTRIEIEDLFTEKDVTITREQILDSKRYIGELIKKGDIVTFVVSEDYYKTPQDTVVKGRVTENYLDCFTIENSREVFHFDDIRIIDLE